MPSSYDSSLEQAKDKVRLLIGDTNTEDPIFSDEEIEGIMEMTNSSYKAVPLLILAMVNDINKLERFMLESSGGVDINDFAELLYEEAVNWGFEVE